MELKHSIKGADAQVNLADNEILLFKKDLYFEVKRAFNNYVALQNARKEYITAIEEYINSLYNYNLALIQVEMAMHYHIVDIHHKSEHAMQYHSEELIEHLNKVLGCDEKDVQKIKNKHNKTHL